MSSYSTEIQSASQKYGVPASVIAGIIQNESGGRNSPSLGNGGGLGQFEPSTWKSLGGGDVTNPSTNINHIGKYLAQLHAQTGSWSNAVGSYYAGVGSVMAHKNNLNYIPSPQSGNSLTVAEYIQHAMSGVSAQNTSYNSGSSGSSGIVNSIGSAVVNPILRVVFIALGIVMSGVGAYLMIKPQSQKIVVEKGKDEK